MGLFDWFGDKKKAQQQIVRLDGPGDFEIEVVGESHYQTALNSIVGGKTEDCYEIRKRCTAHSDSNPYDNKAVAVSIEGEIIGHLDRKLARQFRVRMKEAGVEGHPAVCRALISGGWNRGDGDEGHYGVRLDLPHQ